MKWHGESQLRCACMTTVADGDASATLGWDAVAPRSEIRPDDEPDLSDLFVDSWGSGVPVVPVHGSLAIGADEWQAQRPLAEEGFRPLVPDRRGYGRSPAAEREDFLSDADDIADLMGDGAHLVGHSYGGLGVLFAAARRPDATLSLTLLEPSALALGQHHPAARTLVAEVRRLWDQDLPDEDWVARFLKAVGSDPDALPPELIAAAVPLVPVLRRGRPIWEPELPLAELAPAPPEARRIRWA
jgi:pimeloyl-ACP methyl ester carboxylesterase